MTIDEIKRILQRKAVIFETGGFKPTNEIGESWIGAIKWKKTVDEIPKDIDGTEMLPLASLFTGYMEYIPNEIEGIILCNVFISPNILDHLIDMEGYFSVKTYNSIEGLELCDLKNEYMKAFPLEPQLVDNDFPMWDGGMDPDIEAAIIELENKEDIDYYEDIHTEIYPMHKVGGYPAYIQPGRWDDDYEFIFQISSDDKAGLNIVDSGSFYFFYSKKLDKWDVQCDFC